MKLYVKICCVVLVFAGLTGCVADEHPSFGSTATMRLQLSTDGWLTRSFNNPGTYDIDRILIMPFMKSGNDPETDKNYVPASSQIVQLDEGDDFAAFPIQDLTLSLLKGATYKILILGYNSADYDYNDPSNANNNFTVDWIDGQSLSNLSLSPKMDGNQITVPEIFSGFATSGGNEEFMAKDGVTVSCTLNRIVSGLSITLGDVSPDVTSITLTSGTVVSSVWLGDNGISRSVLTGETSTAYAIGTAVPSPDGSFALDVFMLNYVDDTGTPIPMQFAMEVLYDDATTVVYPVQVADADAGTIDEFDIISNRAINLTGEFSNLNFLINIGSALNLDDNLWDGYN